MRTQQDMRPLAFKFNSPLAGTNLQANLNDGISHCQTISRYIPVIRCPLFARIGTFLMLEQQTLRCMWPGLYKCLQYVYSWSLW